jgi:hypothetical protein
MLYNQIVSKLFRFFGVVFLVVSLLAGTGAHVAAQAGTASQYFADTGHNVGGDFWLFYRGVPNAADVFGSPITEQFTDPTSGRVIQYFQRARFEYYPEREVGQRVQIAALGEYVYQRVGNSGTLDAATPIGCRYYAETGFSICYTFLEFFDKNGGETVFGKPKSSFVFYNGRIVQYFERARFEWYPEYPEGSRVVLAELGRIYFDLVPEDPTLLQPVKPDNYIGDVITLYARAFTWKAVTRLDDQQSVYVVVQDQTLAPVQGATAIVTIYWPNGGNQSLADTTNTFGIVTVPFRVQGQPHGSLVTIQVEVLYQGKSSKTVTSFRVW